MERISNIQFLNSVISMPTLSLFYGSVAGLVYILAWQGPINKVYFCISFSQHLQPQHIMWTGQ